MIHQLTLLVNNRIWQKKAYVVQGCGERLPKMKEDFMNYNVEQLVSSASVWHCFMQRSVRRLI